MKQDKSFVTSIMPIENLTNIVVGVMVGFLVLFIPYLLKFIASKIKNLPFYHFITTVYISLFFYTNPS